MTAHRRGKGHGDSESTRSLERRRWGKIAGAGEESPETERKEALAERECLWPGCGLEAFF
jgi:hypothetical protein